MEHHHAGNDRTAPLSTDESDESDAGLEINIGSLLRTPEVSESDRQDSDDEGAKPLEGAPELNEFALPDEQDEGPSDELAKFGVDLNELTVEEELDADAAPGMADLSAEALLSLALLSTQNAQNIPSDDENETGEPLAATYFQWLSLPQPDADDDDDPATQEPQRASTELQVQSSPSRFHVTYRVNGSWTCAALFQDGLLLGGNTLARVHPDGTLQELSPLPEPARQLLVHPSEGWLVMHAGNALFRITEGTWHPQPLPLPKGLTAGVGTRLLTLDDQPKVLAGGALWDLVGRATQLVRDPSLQRVIAVSETSGEYALHRGPNGTALVHLLHNARLDAGWDWANAPAELASVAGHLVVFSTRGELCLLKAPQHSPRRLTVRQRLWALTLGVAGSETMIWFAQSRGRGRVELVEVEFGSGSATRIFETAVPSDGNPRLQLWWSATERTLYLLTGTELTALKRLEA